jgi:hypothetical protein
MGREEKRMSIQQGHEIPDEYESLGLCLIKELPTECSPEIVHFCNENITYYLIIKNI